MVIVVEEDGHEYQRRDDRPSTARTSAAEGAGNCVFDRRPQAPSRHAQGETDACPQYSIMQRSILNRHSTLRKEIRGVVSWGVSGHSGTYLPRGWPEEVQSYFPCCPCHQSGAGSRRHKAYPKEYATRP